MGRIKFTSRIGKWTAEETRKLDVSMLELATDVHRTAKILAPRDKGPLVNSGTIIREGVAHYKIRFGGGRVPYARKRHYENKKNPQTLRYLERAGEAHSRNIKRYLGSLVF